MLFGWLRPPQRAAVPLRFFMTVLYSTIVNIGCTFDVCPASGAR
jgi:hypothetical protein